MRLFNAQRRATCQLGAAMFSSVKHNSGIMEARDKFAPTLIHDPIYLRAPAPEDYDAWVSLREASRAHLTAWEQDWTSADITPSAFRRRLRLYKHDARGGRALNLFTFRQRDAALIGGVALTNIRFGAARSAMLGYWIGKTYLRQGYGRLAVSTVLTHGFGRLKLNRIEAACQPGNTGSAALLTACGFEREGRAADYLHINGKWRDHDIYAMTARRFRDRCGA